MKMSSVVGVAKIAFAILLTQAATVVAADIKLVSASGMTSVLNELAPQFERTTGHKLVIQYGLAALKQQIEAGETLDLVILPPRVMDALIKQGKIAGGTHTVIARSGMGVAVRAGAPRPDIGSVDAFKRTLLNAKSIAYVPEGSTGIHLAKVLERLGITELVKAKTRPQQGGADHVAQAVADGEAELGFAVISNILPVRGAEVLGPFPPELQNYVVYTVGVGASAKEPEAAKALINFLRTESAASVLKARGMEPVAP
jgi:molybdate transport system substrate-binding protein